MTKEQFRTLIIQVMETKILKLQDDGSNEYAHDEEDTFANFNRGAKELDISRWTVLWVLFLKHKDGVAAYIKGHRSQRENVRGRIYDMILYLFLLLGMIEEDEANEVRSNVACSCGKQGSSTDRSDRSVKAHGPGSIVNPTKDGRGGTFIIQDKPT